MDSVTTTQYPSAAISAKKILNAINKLRNTEVTNSSVYEIIASISNFFNYCNAKFLKDFPVDLLYKSSNTYQTEIKSWCQPNLNLTNIHEFVISAFENLERNLYHTKIEISNRCIDALQVLVDYFSVIVLSKIDYCLKLQKRLDELQSSNSIKTSIHLANGDIYG